MNTAREVTVRDCSGPKQRMIDVPGEISVRGERQNASRLRLAATMLSCAAGVLLTAGAASALQPCESNCATLQATSGSGRPGSSVPISISFAQGPNDGQTGTGNDETAAVAFTLGMPGTGADPAPLTLPCVNSGDGSPNKLAPGAVEVGAAIADDFRVVIENAECVNRDHCLCPGAAPQRRDDFVNVVVYGPRDLPDQGPVDIPVLPSEAVLVTLNLRVANGTAAQVLPLHLFAETDNGTPTKPQFAAFTSIGDESGVDQSADRDADRSQIAFSDGQVTIGEAQCVGDCDSSGSVSISKLVIGVNIALGTAELGSCPSFDENASDSVEVDELITGVNNALNGCP